jgi:parallel beta-helix repeat protein
MFCTAQRLIGLAFGVIFAVGACGGGGGTPAPTPPCAADTKTCYVRSTTGNDSNTGASADSALRTITRAAQLAQSGYTIVVGPGTYREGVTTVIQGATPQTLTFLADVSGSQTGDPAGAVVVDAGRVAGRAGFQLSNSDGTVIDGFTITGAPDAGIVLKTTSNDFQIRNCTVHGNPGDGIRIQDSANVVVFNNLIYGNGGLGVGAVGTPGNGSAGAHVINNTIFGNGDRGITMGTSKAASPNAFVRNNIVQGNGVGKSPPLENIKVFTSPGPDSEFGYNADFNLVFPPTYLPPTRIVGNHDIGQDAAFVNAGAGDFHLQPNSPAIDRGDSLIGMASLANSLRGRTTTGGTNCDQSALDMGFHYPRTGPCTSVP